MVKATPKKITSLQHPVIKHLVSLRKSSSYRDETQSILVISETIISELPSTCHFKSILVTDKNPLQGLPTADFTYEVTPEMLHKITGLEDSGGICAEVALPPSQSLKQCSHLLVLDGLADPGNVGTLLRTALAFGWEGVFVLSHGVDLFNDKVIRASRGALFYLPYQVGTLDDLKQLANEEGFSLLVADVEGEPISTIEPSKKVMLILSNEARGPAAHFDAWGKKITIPMKGKMESLNVAVAGGILLYELMPNA